MELLEVKCRSSGNIRRFAPGTTAPYALHAINCNLEPGAPLTLHVKAVRDGEEPVSFGRSAALADYGRCWQLQIVTAWNESAVSFLPEYLRMLCIKILSNFNEIEDIVEPYDKYRMAYIKKQFKSQSKNYLQETKWFNDNYIPSFKEHVDVTLVSTGVPFLFFVALMAAGQVVTKEAFNVTDMVRASGEMGRYLNDIASYKRGKNTSDVASTVECYMKEHGVTGEEAMVAIATMVEQAWRRINRAYMEMDCTVEPAARWLLDMTRMLEIYYLHGRDGLTYGRDQGAHRLPLP